MDYNKFDAWKNNHSTQMQDLTFAKPFDYFIFTRFTQKSPVPIEGKQILFAETIDEVIGYIRHIFLYDILNDVSCDLEYDLKNISEEQQTDAIIILNYWFKLGKISTSDDCKLEVCKLCKDFNLTLSDRATTEYEIIILNGADELRRFLNKRYSNCEKFDKKRLSALCSKDLFAGAPLKEFIDSLFL